MSEQVPVFSMRLACFLPALPLTCGGCRARAHEERCLSAKGGVLRARPPCPRLGMGFCVGPSAGFAVISNAWRDLLWFVAFRSLVRLLCF